jgi:hypothetical protein
MEWIIKIEGKKDRRILITFDPLRESIIFTGQFKPSAKDMVNADIKNGFIWVNIAEDLHSMKIEFTELQTIITKIYNQMEERLKVHEDLAKVFTVFKIIEIKEENQ